MYTVATVVVTCSFYYLTHNKVYILHAHVYSNDTFTCVYIKIMITWLNIILNNISTLTTDGFCV